MTAIMLEGMKSAFNLIPKQGYIMPSRDGFSQDANKMRQDVGNIGSDMRKAIKKAESEQTKKYARN
jgi:hypothetical protein